MGALSSDLYESFTTHFTVQKRQPTKISTLSDITHGKKESLRSYIDCFTQLVVELDGGEEGLKCWIFENVPLLDSSFIQKLGHREDGIVKEILNKAQTFINFEEKLNARFDNPTAQMRV